jgi:quinol monooxygenase YgiN
VIVYEVSIEVDRAAADAYADWLRDHVAQILRIDGFLQAQRHERCDLPADAPRRSFVIVYRVRDQAALDAYFADHAAALRADGERRFGGRFSASRRVLRLLD